MADLFTEWTPVVDFRPTTVPFESERRHRRWLIWPAYAYRILIPSRQKAHFNIFQRVVLQLCRAGIHGNAEMAASCALSAELVAYIVEQLISMDLLDRERMLTSRASRLLAEEESSPVMQEAGFVFVDAISGLLWPRLYKGALPHVEAEFLQPEKALRPKEARILRGSPGRPEPVTARIIWPIQPSAHEAPTTAMVLRAARQHNRRCREWARQAAQIGEEGSEVDLTLVRDIRVVGSEPLPVFVTCNLFMPTDVRQRTWLVTDPCGLGVTDLVRRSIVLLAEGPNGKFIQKLITQLTNEAWRIDEGDMEALFEQARENASGRISRLLGQAGGILQNDILLSLQESEVCYDRILANPALKTADLEEYIRHAYVAVESLFRWMVDLYPDPSLSRCLGPIAPANAELLHKIACHLGFTISARAKGLLYATEGTVKAVLQHNRSSLRGSLPAALLAARAEASHPLSLLASRLPDALDFVADLDARRGSAAHHGEQVPTKEQMETVRAGLFAFLRAVLGDTQTETSLGQSRSLQWGASIPLKLRARAEVRASRIDEIDLYPELKVRTVEMYTAALMLRSLSPSTDQQSAPSGPSSEFVIRAVILLEAIAKEVLRQSPNPNLNYEELLKEPRERCERRIVQAATACGFIPDKGGRFPPSIIKVAPKRIRNVVKWGSGSISALLSAGVLMASDDEHHPYRRLASSVPDLLLIAGWVAEKRGHGDRISISLREQERMEADVIRVLKASLTILE